MTSIEGRQLLVVDDEPDLVEITSAMLELEGARVVTASGGHEAQTHLSKRNFDAVVSDMRMPQGNGLELLSFVASRPEPRPPLILVTGFSDLTAQEAYAMGAGAMLPKPCDFGLLQSTLFKLLTPRATRWATPDSAVSGAKLQLDLQRCEVGAGGFFIPLTAAHPPLPPRLAFDLRFVAGEIQRLEGTGVVRWTRAESEGTYAAGAGIEITSLADHCREHVAAYLSRLRPVAFVPRG